MGTTSTTTSTTTPKTSTTTSTTIPTTSTTSTIEPSTNGADSSDVSGNSTMFFDHVTEDVQIIESCNGTLTLFTKTYNRGEEIEITEDIEDLEGFDNKAVTAALTGKCCWSIFSETDFSGAEKTLRPSETYTGASSLGRELFRNVSSVRKVSC